MKITGSKFLNSSSSLVHSDPFDIFEGSESTIPLFEASSRKLNSIPESTGSRSTLTENIDTLAHSINNH